MCLGVKKLDSLVVMPKYLICIDCECEGHYEKLFPSLPEGVTAGTCLHCASRAPPSLIWSVHTASRRPVSA